MITDTINKDRVHKLADAISAALTPVLTERDSVVPDASQDEIAAACGLVLGGHFAHLFCDCHADSHMARFLYNFSHQYAGDRKEEARQQ